MASNGWGDLVTLTSFGESHGTAIGGVIDGFPAGHRIDLETIQQAVERRRPGRSAWVSPRQETDQVEWLSGLLEGVTTGAPLAFLIRNQDARSEAYASLQSVWRPGHAQWSYQQKYGRVEHRGGGRSSARETAVRVVAGALADQWLEQQGVVVGAELLAVGSLRGQGANWGTGGSFQQAWERRQRIDASALFCADAESEQKMQQLLEQILHEGDSIGAVVEGWVVGLPPGWGDPLARKLEAELASACLSLPASKGFEVGEGFAAAGMRGSQHNDGWIPVQEGTSCASNHAGGILGGISTGLPVVFRVAFKPTSSIRIPQMSCTTQGEPCSMSVGEQGRHDPCVGVRAVPVVRAVTSWVLLNAALRQRLARAEPVSKEAEATSDLASANLLLR